MKEESDSSTRMIGNARLRASVIVCTRNRARILSECIESLLRQDLSREPYEVLVIDDGSTDETSEVVTSLQERSGCSNLRYYFQEHCGLNAARNAGTRKARGCFVAFVDDDELAPPEYLSKVLARIESTPSRAGVGGPVKGLDKGGPRTCGRCSLVAVDLPGEGVRRVPRLLGGNMVIDKQVFGKVGLFDPRLSGRGDETEWFQRAEGLDFLYDPELWLWHRSDHLSLASLVRKSFLQGRSLPLAKALEGSPYRPKPLRVARYLGHALRYCCVKGLVLAMRELGAAEVWVTSRRLRQTS